MIRDNSETKREFVKINFHERGSDDNQNMKKILIVFLLGIIIIFGFFIAMASMQNKNKQTYRMYSDKIAVIKQIEALQRLETAKFTLEKIIDIGTSGSEFREILFGDRILLIAHGDVIAGFDLTNLKDEDVQISDGNITLTFPPPQILVARLDNEKTRVYDRKQGLLSKGDKNLESEARRSAEGIIKTAACDGGILEQASENAKKQITLLLKSLAFQTVTIIIPRGNC